MLLIDEVSLDAEGIAHGIYRIPEDAFYVQGHFPGNPIVPGVILCEIMAQCSAFLMVDRLPGRNTLYRGIDKVKFKGMVRPGDVCEITCRLLDVVETPAGIVFNVDGRLSVSSRLCCRGQLEFVLTPQQ